MRTLGWVPIGTILLGWACSSSDVHEPGSVAGASGVGQGGGHAAGGAEAGDSGSAAGGVAGWGEAGEAEAGDSGSTTGGVAGSSEAGTAGVGGEGGELQNDPLGDGGASSDGIPFKLVGSWGYSYSEYSDEVTGHGVLKAQADGEGSFEMWTDVIAGSPPHDNVSGGAWVGTIAVDTANSTITLHATEYTPLDGSAQTSTDVLVFDYRYLAQSDTLILSANSGVSLCVFSCEGPEKSGGPGRVCEHTL